MRTKIIILSISIIVLILLATITNPDKDEYVTWIKEGSIEKVIIF
ncbi:hypothetical protein [Anaeromicrobium sediminis]|nr:hypothetical protein [Anaeromicrobium sediminis]